MRFDLARLWRKLSSRSRIGRLAALRIDVMDRHVRVGDRRLLQILIHAAAAANVTAFQFDRYARSASNFRMLMRVFRGACRWNRIMRHPLDTVFGNVSLAFFA